MTDVQPPSAAEIEMNAARIAPFVRSTPMVWWESPTLEAALGAETQVALKLELFQHSGTFKVRGALSVMLRLSPGVRARGVTAVSAGNHAVAVAYAARRLGVSAKVVMAKAANPARVAAARAYGAEVLLAEDGKAGFELARAIEAQEGRAFVHPFEGEPTVLGSASLGREWSQQAGPLDAIIVAIGGGGLCAGVGAAFHRLQPSCEVFGVEPTGADTMTRSFAAGQPVALERLDTIADTLAPPYALPYSFGVCRKVVTDIVRVSDGEMRDGMRLLFREMRIAVEPACAAATAALVGPLRERLRGKRVGVLACGSNIDQQTYSRWLSEA